MKKNSLNWLLVLFSTILILGLSETVLRYIPTSLLPNTHKRFSPIYRHELGTITNKPNSIQIKSTPWVYNLVTYNKYGFRGPDWPLGKNSGEIRVAVLGDSYIEGLEVNFDELASTVLEKQMASRCTVMNFGLSGTGQAEQLLIYRNLVRSFNPDIVIHCVTPSNDFEDNTQELTIGNKNRLKIQSDQLVEIPLPCLVKTFLSPPVNKLTYLLTNTSLFRLVAQFAKTNQNYLLYPFLPASAWASTDDPSLVPLLKFETPAYDEAKEIMGKALLSLRATCEQNGSYFLLTSVSGCWTFMALENPWFAKKSELLALRYKWLEQFTDEHSIEYLDLNKTLLQQYRSMNLTSADIHIPWDGHWTPLGHQMAAESIYTFLKRKIPTVSRPEKNCTGVAEQ